MVLVAVRPRGSGAAANVKKRWKKSDSVAKWTEEERKVKSFYLLSLQPPVPLCSTLSFGQVQKKCKKNKTDRWESVLLCVGYGCFVSRGDRLFTFRDLLAPPCWGS